MPATAVREVVFDPPLPDAQREAVWRALRTRRRRGAAVLLQFDARFWKRARRPNAFGSDQPFGAVWDGNEHQRGRPGILSLLAGGGASAALQQILATRRLDGLLDRLTWLGKPTAVLHARAVTWEDDPWVKGRVHLFESRVRPALA